MRPFSSVSWTRPGGARRRKFVDMLTELYVRWLQEVWGRGDFAVAEQLLHPALVDHNRVPGQPAGREGNLWAANQVRTAFPDLKFTADVVFERGDLVTGRWTMTGTHTGPLEMLGLPPTGRPVTMSGQEIFRAVDGRFVEVWHLEDVGALMRSLELEPPALMLRLAARRSARRYRKERSRN
jgi:predicted ester cyclase